MTETVQTIGGREGFVAFVRALACTAREDPAAVENQDLGAYLEALAAWVEDMDGYFRNRGEPIPTQPSWQLLGEMLAAARVYE